MKTPRPVEAQEGANIRINLFGLTLFSVALIIVTGLLTYALITFREAKTVNRNVPRFSELGDDTIQTHENTPWGELVTSDITLNAPEEYVTFEARVNSAPTWTLEGMTLVQSDQLMSLCGFSKEQIQQTLALATVVSNNVVIHPDKELVFSLSPAVRSKFYTALGHFSSNFYMQWPFCYPRQSFETCMEKSEISPATLASVRKLLYPRGDAVFFSDYDTMLLQIPTEAERIHLAEALMRQPAVLARLRIRPNTDIDKILGYWGRGGKAKDLRPLLESIERLEDGGSISILYLLPPFARNRLYTFPMPSKTSDPVMDCHWSTMNFFRDVPDNQFSNSEAVVARLNSDFYRVGKPSLYGDVIVLLDEQGKGIHSAVYLADDIVFTKNGNNFQMPWKLMRLSDLLAVYGTPSLSARMQIFRNKRW